MEIQEIIIFNGIKYKLMGGQKKYYLSQSTTNKGRKNPKGLHVAIWEFYNKQEVPKGYCIHHKDGNTFNNDIDNLECIQIREHLSMHSKNNFENEEYASKNKEILKKAREKANKWHSSEEGIEWHKKHYKKSLEKVEYKTFICKQCGKEFKSKQSRTMFCCELCRGRYYRKNKKFEVKCKCSVCGKDFIKYKSQPSIPTPKTCSKKCTAQLAAESRRKRKESASI